MAFIATAVIAALSSAFAFRPCGCENAQQYRWTGSGYAAIGVNGVDYFCNGSGGVCTFYVPDPFGHPNTYAPCRVGAYTPINYKEDVKNKK